MGRFTITWSSFIIKEKEKVACFQDPVFTNYIPCEEFVKIYGPLLETFDGGDMCSYVDFFFRPSPINKTMYEFVDEDCRTDFRTMAEDMDLIPKLKEVMEGENEIDKKKRQKKEEKKKETKETKEKETKMERIKNTIDKILHLLENETDQMVRKKLEEKLKRTIEHSQKTV